MSFLDKILKFFRGTEFKEDQFLQEMIDFKASRFIYQRGMKTREGDADYKQICIENENDEVGVNCFVKDENNIGEFFRGEKVLGVKDFKSDILNFILHRLTSKFIDLFNSKLKDSLALLEPTDVYSNNELRGKEWLDRTIDFLFDSLADCEEDELKILSYRVFFEEQADKVILNLIVFNLEFTYVVFSEGMSVQVMDHGRDGHIREDKFSGKFGNLSLELWDRMINLLKRLNDFR